MKMFGDCSGECCACACGDFCIAGDGDDDFSPASKEKIIDRLDNEKYPDCRAYMIDYLKKNYGIDCEPEEEPTELKPCPFCGGEAKLCASRSFYGQVKYAHVYCQGCKIIMQNYATEKEAMDAWNRRC